MNIFSKKPDPLLIRPLETSGDVQDAGAAFLVRRTWLILGVFFLPLFVWSLLADVEEVSHVQGQVMPGGSVHVVQHLEGGIVSEILVHENQTVEKDDILFRLDNSQNLPEREQAELTLAAMQAKAIRLRAFKSGIRPDFSEMSPRFASIIAAEEINHDHQLNSLKGNQAVLDVQIAQRRLDLQQAQEDLKIAREQEIVTASMVKIRKELVEEQAISRVIYLETLRANMTAQGEVKRLKEQIDNMAGALNETVQRRSKLSTDAQNDANIELGSVMNEMAQVRETIPSINDQKTRLDVRSPVRGIIQELLAQTPGRVIQKGEILARIVPLDDPLLVEVRIPPQEVGRVVKGQSVSIKLNTYEFSRFGTIPGTLLDISPSSLVKVGEPPYFKGIVNLEKDHAGHVPGLHLVLPGMQALVDIPLGNRSVLAAIFEPISHAVQTSFRER